MDLVKPLKLHYDLKGNVWCKFSHKDFWANKHKCTPVVTSHGLLDVISTETTILNK